EANRKRLIRTIIIITIGGIVNFLKVNNRFM
ncbi:MAG: hypothetical protein ACI9Q3_000391, partial [Maribacter sp.]